MKKYLLCYVLFLIGFMTVAQTRTTPKPVAKPKVTHRKQVQYRPKGLRQEQPKPNTEKPTPVTSTTTQPTAATATAAQPQLEKNQPALSTGFMGSTTPLGYLFAKLTTDTASRQRQSGSIGLSATLFFNGTFLVGVTSKKSVYYYTAGTGLYKNPLALTTQTNPVVYAGAGIIYKPKVLVGALLSAVPQKTYQTLYTNGQYDYLARKTIKVGFGLTATYQLRKGFWLNATYHTQFGTGLGGTYFF